MAAAMIRRAVDSTPDLAEALDHGRLAIGIRVDRRGWVRPVAKVIGDVFREYCTRRHPQKPAPARDPIEILPSQDDFDLEVLQEVPQVDDYGDYPDPPLALPRWSIFHHSPSSGSRHELERLDDALAEDLAAGTGSVFVAAPSEQFPPAFSAALDFELELRPPTGAMVAAAMAECAGQTPAHVLPEELCALLDSLDFCLAGRAATTVDDWTRRLERTALGRIPVPPPVPPPIPPYLPGMPEFVDWAERLRRDLQDYRDGLIAWPEVAGRGVVLVGPPGVGKTQQLITLAARSGIPLISTSHGRWQSAGHQGDMLAAMARTFEDAARQKLCLVFVDELDAFLARGRGGNPSHESYNHQVMNFFLELLDGAAGRTGIIVVGACNFVERLDPALIRPGRMERVIRIGLPDQDVLAQILRYHLGEDVLADADLSGVAALAAGRTGADCELAVRSARGRARAGRRQMELADLEAEFAPPEPLADNRGPALRRLCAVHEAGHAVTAVLLQPGFLVSASISPSVDGGLGGVLYSAPAVDVIGQTEMLALVRILLAGRAAEEIVLGSPSGGAGGDEDSDLGKATFMVARMLANYGFGGQFTWAGRIDAESLPQIFALNSALAKRVEQVLAAQYGSACDLISHYRKAVEAVADLLLARITVSAEDVTMILVAFAPNAANVGGTLQ
ncbi:AAA family ATPase [Nitrospirillum viridazoti]|uniref:Peptidase M41-like protein n=1 Tax=Nitrospirillum amazonense TaxID=28077 RepID=A0A560I5N5_9PROT|nr:AAA family ATPase [Nitrospirillum amazonense]TWB54243.1 peptidase M41-like protein [Nitrospirillum amazonense]